MDASSCIDALEETLRRYDPPESFNSDQGAQFADRHFITALERSGTRISMDGKGRRRDNVFVERYGVLSSTRRSTFTPTTTWRRPVAASATTSPSSTRLARRANIKAQAPRVAPASITRMATMTSPRRLTAMQ
jgi:transposase InsO family protein